MRTELVKSAMAVFAVMGVAAAFCISSAHAEDGPQATLQSEQSVQLTDAEVEVSEGAAGLQEDGAIEAEPVALFVGAEVQPLEFALVTDDSRTFDEYGDPDEVTVRYWGDGDAIAALQEIVWNFDIDDPDNRMLPLGVAPFSSDTAPNGRSLAAVAVMTTIEGSVIFMGDENGLVGVRTAGTVEVAGSLADVHEDGNVIGIVGCTAVVGDCSCTATGQGASCRKWNANGKSWAECSDTTGTERCWAKGNACECGQVVVVP